MAKVLLSPAITDARGSLGGMVFTRGATGAILRVKRPALTSATILQLGLRGALATWAKKWDDTLTPTQRAGWKNLAALHPRTDQLLKSYTLTGMQLYVSVNQALKQIGEPPTNDAPAAYSCGSPTAVTIAWTPPAGPLTIDSPIEPAANEVPVIWASPNLPGGRTTVHGTSVKGKLRFLASYASGSAGPHDITAIYTAAYGAFKIGQLINFKLQFTDKTNGCQGIAAIGQQFLHS